mmetsp:Transcript_66023/g.180993  ORF Transcript_66023/g.180993 Transcript_66023/m.180993 type:complete len:252 (-) Transcript_66023:83-838(-)|eukprot:3293025-Prymnesium_polylepis.1
MVSVVDTDRTTFMCPAIHAVGRQTPGVAAVQILIQRTVRCSENGRARLVRQPDLLVCCLGYAAWAAEAHIVVVIEGNRAPGCGWLEEPHGVLPSVHGPVIHEQLGAAVHIDDATHGCVLGSASCTMKRTLQALIVCAGGACVHVRCIDLNVVWLQSWVCTQLPAEENSRLIVFPVKLALLQVLGGSFVRHSALSCIERTCALDLAKCLAKEGIVVWCVCVRGSGTCCAGQIMRHRGMLIAMLRQRHGRQRW